MMQLQSDALVQPQNSAMMQLPSDIGVVGSPSTNTELTVDLLMEASEERIVGALVGFRAVQSGKEIMTVGQITSVELRNKWHEDAVFRNLIKRTGEIPPITNRQDTRTASLAVGATFSRNTNNDEYQPDVLGMVPPTGTRVFRLTQDNLLDLLRAYQNEVFYLGRAYSNDIMLPMWFKHFGSGARGAGEAYHLGIFGKTGSGKSGLAKMLLLAYARHREMGILVIDPQGEFSLEIQGTRVGSQELPLDRALTGMGREVRLYRVSDLQLDEWDLLEELLVSMRFTEQLGIPAASVDNSRRAAEVIRNALEAKYKLDSLCSKECLEYALDALTRDENAEYVYSTRARKEQLQNRMRSLRVDSELSKLYSGGWYKVANLFASGEGRRKLFGIVNDLIQGSQDGKSRPVVVIDISNAGNPELWTEDLQKRILNSLLRAIVTRSQQLLHERSSANVLVILDEAHRHAPSSHVERGSQADILRTLLRTAVRETRKYGVGWCFISQTLGGLDSEIVQQLRIVFFGFGLALGEEFRRLREFVGGDEHAMGLYQSFRDPQSFPRRELVEFPFMVVGPVSPLSFSGRPLFFTAFTKPEEFLEVNKLVQQQQLPLE
ncbi:MAG: ATP-binding protein [Armatimonadota bacterium]|nr:ATP-binding protein [Armatimonadota bacterium]